MKIVIALIAAAGIGSAATYMVIESRPAKQAEAHPVAPSKVKAKPEKSLLTSKSKTTRVESAEPKAEPPAARGLTANEIIEGLIEFKPAADKGRNAALRTLIHRFETLNDMGPAALPAIKTFLSKNQDVEFLRDRGGEGNGESRGGGRGRNNPSPWAWISGGGRLPEADTLYPASLRLGLFEVARQIGGTEAEAMLAGVLGETARGIEVVHLARVLDEMAPGKYRDQIIAAAKELLGTPPSAEGTSQLDEMGRNYLFGLLSKYQDKSFADKAQEMLVSGDGRVNNAALNYLTETLKEQSLPLLYKVYKDPSITNGFSKLPVITAALNYAGQHPQADAMFKEMVLDEKNQTGRWMVVGNLMRIDEGTPVEVIKARQALLASVKPEIKDERLVGMVDRVNQEMERRLDPNAPPREGGFRTLFFGPQGGGDAGGNPGGGGSKKGGADRTPRAPRSSNKGVPPQDQVP